MEFIKATKKKTTESQEGIRGDASQAWTRLRSILPEGLDGTRVRLPQDLAVVGWMSFYHNHSDATNYTVPISLTQSIMKIGLRYSARDAQ